MATVNHERLKPQGVDGDDVAVIRWTPLTTTDPAGDWISIPRHADISVHVFGTFGAACVLTMQGSNEVAAAPTAAVALLDTLSAALTFLTAGGNAMKQAVTAPVRVRPNITSGGDGTTTLTVILKARRNK